MRLPSFLLLLLLLLLPFATSARAEPPAHEPLNLDLPLLDMPANESFGYTVPSMAQSLAVTRDVYSVAHYGIGKALDLDQGSFMHRFFARMGLYAFDGISMFAPFGLSWMHEEWHRAVMSHRQVASHDDVYDLKLTSLIAVSHETDQDLADLKNEHPHDLVRLDEAGMESQHQLTSALEADLFFAAPRLNHYFLLWLNELQVEGYLYTCTGRRADDATNEQNKRDGADIQKRDFTGLDCTGWVYDLFRPNEPYAERGAHPSGVGVNRYRHFSDLDAGERDFLVLQRSLGFLNFVDPILLRLPALPLMGGTATGNLRHYLTAFGYAVDLNVLDQSAAGNAVFILHTYRNGKRAFPGLEADFRSHHFGTVDLSPRFGLWQQPDGQSFTTAVGKTGGFVGARAKMVEVGPAWAHPYVEVLGKTQGWLAGDVALEAAASYRVGVESPL